MKGEFELIGNIRSRFGQSGPGTGGGAALPDGVTGIGDDCAIMPQRDGTDTLVSTDLLVEGIHFLLDDISARDLGWKAAAVNISDIAAMGGRPVATFLSIAIPSSISEEWIDEFMEGYAEISSRYGVALLGGDTTSSAAGLCINVAVVGECVHGKAVRRSGARPGDLVCVTGMLGDSAAGLKLILEGCREAVCGQDAEPSQCRLNAAERTLLRRHHRPEPQVSAGIALAGSGAVSAMMDISDGVASDLRHIMEESGVGAEILTALVPLSQELVDVCAARFWDAMQLALEGGEDYQLLFTVEPSAEASLGVPHTVIGRMTEDKNLVWNGSDRDFRGFTHF